MENKTGVLLYGAGALTALWFANTIIGAINSVPLVSGPPARAAARMC